MADRGRLLDRIVAFFRAVPAPAAASAPGAVPPVIVTVDGFVDIELGLRRLGPGRPPRFRLGAMAGSREIGLEVVLGDSFSRSEIGPGIPIWPGTVRLRSLGAPSDAFLSFLDEQYGTGRNPLKMRQEVSATAAVLEGNPGQPERGLRMKLFFEEQGELSEPEEDEEETRPETPEVYLNLNPAGGRASWSEKDEGYRSDLVFALTEPAMGP